LLVIAGLLLEGWVLALLTGLTILSLTVIVIAEVQGVLVITPEVFVPAYDLMVIVTLCLITAVTMHFLKKDLIQSIRQLRQNEQALAKANDELRREIAERKQAENALQEYQATLQTRSESLAIINTITDTLHQSFDAHQVAQQAVQALVTDLQIPATAILTYDEKNSLLCVIASHGLPSWLLQETQSFPLGESLSGHALMRQEIMRCPDIQAEPRIYPSVQRSLQVIGMHSTLFIPLTYLSYKLGVLNLFFHDAEQMVAARHETVLAIAKSISLALANARYVNQIEIEIQERKEAEQALQVERDFAHQIVTNMGQGLSVTDAEGKFSFVNPAFTQMLGYAPEDLQGKTPFDIAAEGEQETLLTVQYNRRSGRATSYETRLRHVDGHAVDVLITGVPQWQGDVFQGTIAVITDLTERKQAEKAQLRFANQLETAVNIAKQVNAILDPEELFPTVVNLLQSRFDLYHVHIYLLDSKCGKLHISAGSGEIGQQLLQRQHYISIDEKHSLVARAAREKVSIWVNDVSKEPDFMPNPLLPSTQSEIAVPVIAHGAVLGVLDVQEDTPYSFSESDVDVLRILAGHIAIALQNANLFAARKEAELRLAELVTELETRNAELERFTYTVSHDLKSPLITIKGFLGLLEKDLAAARQDRIEADMTRIRTAAIIMEQLLHDLLELSRVGRIMNPPEMVAFTTIVEEARERVAGQLSTGRIALKVMNDLPDVYVDRTRIVEVMQNLLDNAIKFMGDQANPQIEIGATCQANKCVCFIRDNGMGIDPRYHDKVFGLFDRLDPSIEGTGIGLALVKRIIEVHNGRIWVESEGSGKGSTFFFTLPREAPGV
ncbi:MAG: GAF domain-containing protein, partial [Anaerolineales bacterium]|nr:GAF domain-containing protein [Anaerolineales bacterium]